MKKAIATEWLTRLEKVKTFSLDRSKYREGFYYFNDKSYNRLQAIYCQEYMNVSSAKRNIPKDRIELGDSDEMNFS